MDAGPGRAVSSGPQCAIGQRVHTAGTPTDEYTNREFHIHRCVRARLPSRAVQPVNPSAAPSKLAVCWFDIVMLIVVVVCGSALWTAARRGVEGVRLHHQPEKLTFDRREDAPLKRAELAVAEKANDSVHAATVDAEMTVARLTAELEAEGRNRPVGLEGAPLQQWTEAQRQRQVKRDTAHLLAKALVDHRALKMRRLVDARAAVADAERLAEMQYLHAMQEFTFGTRLWTLGAGALAWTVLLVGVAVAMRFGGRWVGQCRRGFVLVSALVMLIALATYELLK
jgi:hypothetical protein